MIKYLKLIKKFNRLEKYYLDVKENNKMLIDENNMLKTKMRCLNKENKFLIKRENDLQTLSQMIMNKAKIADIRKFVDEVK